MKMYNFRNLSFFLLLALFITSCKKSKSEVGITGTGIGAVRNTGIPLENIRNTVIGPAGGKLVSRDGRMQITVPAGAVNENINFGITAITSTSDAAMGASYRLSPHIRFNKPVTVSVSYAEQADSVGSPCFLSLGYQDEKGVWRMLTRRSTDEQNKTVSVQTDHFSDWALLTPLKLTPAYSLIAPKEEVVLIVAAFVRIKLGTVSGPGNACNIFADDREEEVFVEEQYILPDQYVDRWISLAGESEGAGRLTRTEKGAVFVASGHDSPLINPVTILCFLKNRQFPMKAVIQILPVQLGVTVQMDGNIYFYEEGSAHADGIGMGIEWEKVQGSETLHGTITFRGLTRGSRPWTEESQFNWEAEGTGPRMFYQSFWDDGLKVSTGFVNITELGKVGEIVAGHFELSNAGEYRAATGTTDIEYVGVRTIRGSFRVIRRD